MGDWIANLAVAHKDLLIGFAVGAVVTHPAALAVAFFNMIVKLPGVGSYIAKNPDKVRSFFDEFDKTIDDLVTKYSQKELPITPEPPKETKVG